MFTKHRRKTIVIVESNQSRQIVFARDLDSLGPQHFVEGRKMQHLGVGNRSIEIEYDGANHVRESLSVCENRNNLTLPRLAADHRAAIFTSHIELAAYPEFSRQI